MLTSLGQRIETWWLEGVFGLALDAVRMQDKFNYAVIVTNG